MAEYARPIPVADEASAPFYEGARRHQLVLARCGRCGQWRLPSREHCPDCWSTDVRYEAASGRGILYSFAVMHQKLVPGFEDLIPYHFAIVELDEGPRLVTNIVGVPNEALRVGMRVEAVYDDVSDETTLIRFRPAEN